MEGNARHWSEEYRFRHEDGSYRWFWDRGVLMRDASGKPLRFIGCMTDISAQRVAEERIWQLANQDELTGLPNRKVFHGQLKTLEETSEGDQRAAVLLIDIDHFKDVNDSLGHPAGDALLKEVAARLKASVGEKGTVFRLGGDEFAILLPGHGRETSTAMAASRAHRACANPVVIADQMVNTRRHDRHRAVPRPWPRPAALLQNADLALYEGKNRGRNQAVCFEPSLRAALERRMSLLGEVRIGTLMQRFRPYYQPVVSLRDGSVKGVEALMRWEHPERGLLTPGIVYGRLRRRRAGAEARRAADGMRARGLPAPRRGRARPALHRDQRLERGLPASRSRRARARLSSPRAACRPRGSASS